MSTVKGLFLMNLGIVGILLALAVYQVPQPWRGILVAWLLFLASAGTFVLRLLAHHYQYRKLKLEREKKARQGTHKRREQRRLNINRELNVVHSSGGGRHTI
ncbi:MAG: hypothetical protein U9R48_10125 [Chloroflexota bacterium]|nr:hypothetical protein [Chloroflexota bacterium]